MAVAVVLCKVLYLYEAIRQISEASVTSPPPLLPGWPRCYSKRVAALNPEEPKHSQKFLSSQPVFGFPSNALL